MHICDEAQPANTEGSEMKRRTATIFFTCSVAAICFCLFSPQANLRAQVTTATIYGTVTDSTGAVVPNANVTIVNNGTLASKKTVSSNLGQFSFSFLPPGDYSIRVRKAGFKTYDQAGIVANAGQRASISVALQVGAATQQVTVTGTPPLLATSPQQNQIDSSREVEQLPLLSRDYTSLLTVSNGVNLQTHNGTIYLNNLPSAATSFTVDGVPAPGDAGTNSLSEYQNYNNIKGLNEESIGQIEVAKSVYSAEVSSLSGNINLISRSGTNNWHGSLFENYQAGGLNARDPFSPASTSLVRHQYGGSLGGPIIKNKVFVFGSIEKPNLISQATQVVFVPTPSTRQAMIAANPAVKPVIDFFPLPNQPYQSNAVVGEWIGQNGDNARDLFGHIRGDWYLNSSNSVTLEYTRAHPRSTQPRHGIEQRTWQGSQHRGTASFTHSAAAWTSETRFGFNLSDTRRIDNPFTVLSGFPVVRCDCGFRIDGEDRSDGGTNMVLMEVLSMVHGRHNIKVGGRWGNTRPTFADVQSPEFRFRTVQDFINSNFRQVQFTWGVKPTQLRLSQFGGFIQDDFRLTNQLTLNLGARYDYWTVVKEKNNRLFNRSGAFGFGTVLPPGSTYNADYNNIQPRFGFAYQLNSKTVIRSGFGIFNSGHVSYGTFLNMVQDGPNLPLRVTLSGSQAAALGVTYPTSNDQAQAMGVRTGLISSPVVDTNYPNPQSLQWTFGFERELFPNTLLSASYVGNHAIHGNLLFEENLPSRVTGQIQNAAFGEFPYITAGESSRYDALQISLRRKFAHRLTLDANYSYSRTLSYSGDADILNPSPPQVNNQVFLEHGPANIDIPDRFTASFVYDFPHFGRAGAVKRYLLGGWETSGIVSAQDGNPVNIIQGGTFSDQRPDLLAASPNAAILNQGLQYLNPSAFQAVPDGPGGVAARPGMLSRNAFRTPGYWNMDLALAKNIRFGESRNLQLRLEGFNALNHTKLINFVSNLGGGFGQFVGTTAPRVVQLSARFSF